MAALNTDYLPIIISINRMKWLTPPIRMIRKLTHPSYPGSSNKLSINQQHRSSLAPLAILWEQWMWSLMSALITLLWNRPRTGLVHSDWRPRACAINLVPIRIRCFFIFGILSTDTFPGFSGGVRLLHRLMSSSPWVGSHNLLLLANAPN